MFTLKNITKTFDKEVALSDVSLSILGGMNYIIGASGSGKTTLLRILSAMDVNYHGEASYQGKNLKTLTESEKAQIYATEFGFIAQGFHLIEELSVRENILLPSYLKNKQSEKQLKILMQQLNIQKLENQKVKTLSGGEKQRVAIARELMKNPKVLIADEPTAALDEKTSKDIIALLRTIAKDRTVIIVTHDTSLIQGNCSVFELDKGVLCKCGMASNTAKTRHTSLPKRNLSMASALQMAKVNGKRQFGKILSIIIALTVAASCLTINFSGVLGASSDEAFDELLKKQGNSVLNLNVVPSFMGAAATGEEGSTDSQSVTQNIDGIMEKYQDDSRVEAIIMDAPIDNMVLTLGGKDFIVESTGQAPVFNKMVVGKIADNSKNEIVLSQVLVKKLGKTNKEILGKKLSFIGSVYNWDSGKAVEMPVSFDAIVSGVADTSYGIAGEGEYKDEVMKFENEDSLFLSQALMKDVYKQAKKKDPSFPFVIRPTNPQNYLDIYEELMADGIVPLGQVELIRDIVGIRGETANQTGISYTVISILSLLAALSVCFVSSFMRKKEYAIHKLSGYAKKDMLKLIAAEYIGIFIVSGILCSALTLIFHEPLWLGIALSFGVSALCYLENCIVALRVNTITTLKTGER
ncbi:MAG: ATP-binding cassette domain-containing protein [Anaerovoracaceae bacterium]